MDKIYTSVLDLAVNAVKQNNLEYLKENIHAKGYLIVCLKIALSISNTETIDLLIDKLGIHGSTDCFGNPIWSTNCFGNPNPLSGGDKFSSLLDVIYHNNRVDIVKHLIARHNIFLSTNKILCPLIDASHYDINLDMVKYLINIPYFSLYHTSPYA